MLALGQPRELERGDRSGQPPLVGQTTLPGAQHLALLAVIGLLRARELTGVVALRLTRAERFRDRQHSGYSKMSIAGAASRLGSSGVPAAGGGPEGRASSVGIGRGSAARCTGSAATDARRTRITRCCDVR